MNKCYDMRFDHPATHFVCGPTGSGKTFRTANILTNKNNLIKNGHKIKNIIFCYSQWQDVYEKLKSSEIVTKWVNKMPSNEEFLDLVKYDKDEGGSIVVIDDFMHQIGTDLDEIVRVSSRHNNCSVFILLQNLFPPYKQARQISINVKYFHIHKNPRENNQIYSIARQISPVNSKWIVQSYYEATKNTPYSCLLLDMTQTCPQYLRVRSSYLPHESPMLVWIEKGSNI
jgi:Cdc6-like AAA superfamily ATPase